MYKTIFITDAQAEQIIYNSEDKITDAYKTYRVWPKMLEINKEIKKELRCAFVSNCIQRFIERYPQYADGNYRSNIEYLWYSANKEIDNEEEKTLDEYWESRGYTKIDYQNPDQFKDGTSVFLGGKIENDFLSTELNKGKWRVKIEPLRPNEITPRIFLIAPGKRTRGYYTVNLQDKYFKLT